VDVRSKEGLDFRGWLKGSLAVERSLPPAPTQAARTQKVEGPNPLDVKGITWFWSPKAKEHGLIRLNTGFQSIGYTLTGNVAGTSRSIPPGYNFLGWGLGLVAEFIPLQTTVYERSLYPVIRGGYSFGLHRVSFSNPFPNVPEVAGKAYQLSTNSYSLEGLTRYRAAEFQGGFLQIGLGVGFLYHEVQPDLDPIQGGSYNGEVVFLDTSFSSLTIPFEIYVRAFDDYYFEPRVSWLAMPSISQDASGATGMKAGGLPFQIQMTFGYLLSELWSVEAEAEYLFLSGSSTGTTTRLGTTYTDGKIDLSYQRYVMGLRYRF